MFPLSHMLKSFVRVGALTVIDADGARHVFGGTPGPTVTMRLSDRSLYRKLFSNPRTARRRGLYERHDAFRGTVACATS